MTDVRTGGSIKSKMMKSVLRRLGTSRAGLEPSQAFSGLELAVFYLRVLKVFEMAHVEVKYFDFFLIFVQIWLDNGF